jgi:hypothetical protein
MQEQQLKSGDIVEIIESKEVTSDFYINPVGATGEIIQLSSFGTAYVKLKDYSEVFSFKLGQLKKQSTNYKIYKNSSNKCFVKYHDQPEKEITNQEYEELLQFKNRMLEAKIKEPVIYEQKEKEYSILAFYDDDSQKKPIKYDPIKDEFGAYNFIYETCKGKFYTTDNSLVINSINNEQKGNGAFSEFISLIKRIMDQNILIRKEYLVIENIYNPNLILNLEKKHGFKKISNTVCVWSKYFS